MRYVPTTAARHMGRALELEGNRGGHAWQMPVCTGAPLIQNADQELLTRCRWTSEVPVLSRPTQR